jgi:DNA-binding MarR family transcriptional regulator
LSIVRGVDDHLPLARLLSAATRLIIELLHRELADAGHPGMRPAYGYALVAVGTGGTTTSRLAEDLGMTKQGAAKLVATLLELGYLERRAHAEDRRARLLTVTPRGRDLLRRSEEIQARLEGEWAELIGERNMRTVRRGLERATEDAGQEALRPIW